jgi:hypothetical protein
MNREDIIRMAEEANGEPAWCGGVDWTWDEVKLFAALVAAAEREECIAACRVYQDDDEPFPGFQNGVSCCIAAIENHEEFLEHMRKKGAP